MGRPQPLVEGIANLPPPRPRSVQACTHGRVMAANGSCFLSRVWLHLPPCSPGFMRRFPGPDFEIKAPARMSLSGMGDVHWPQLMRGWCVCSCGIHIRNCRRDLMAPLRLQPAGPHSGRPLLPLPRPKRTLVLGVCIYP